VRYHIVILDGDLMYDLSEEDLQKIPAILQGLGYEVIAPLKFNQAVKLAPINADSKIELDYIRLMNSPRDFLLPNRETLFKYRSTATITSYGLKIRFPTVEGPCPAGISPEYSSQKKKLAFFGIHPCIANSIRYLDRVMLSDPPDPYYSDRRKDMFLAVLECDEGDEYCLCKTLGSYKVAKGYADILMRKSGNRYIAKPMTPLGETVLKQVGKEISGDYPKIVPRMKKEYEITNADESSIDSKDASETVKSCTLCCACTVTCPTCYCNDIEDRFSLVDPSNVERARTRMSCQRRCYSMIAGGTTFLKSKEDRFKWRLKHKFPFSINSFRLVGCVGCGSCIANCPARIDFRDHIARSVD